MRLAADDRAIAGGGPSGQSQAGAQGDAQDGHRGAGAEAAYHEAHPGTQDYSRICCGIVRKSACSLDDCPVAAVLMRIRSKRIRPNIGHEHLDKLGCIGALFVTALAPNTNIMDTARAQKFTCDRSTTMARLA
jgi:hypothetical protein